jgi:type I restriction enzyme S subunit
MSDTGETLPVLSKGWAWTTLENSVEILDSQRKPINSLERKKRIAKKSKSELIPYYGATGQVDWIDDYLFDEELVLLGEDGAPFLYGLKDKAYIIRGKSWVNNHAHVLRAINNIMMNSYLCYYLNTFHYHGYVTGTTRLKLNQSQMRKIPIPLAPFLEQHRIVTKIEELLTKLYAGVEGLRKIQAQLKVYRQTVLNAAMTGKLTEQWRAEHKDELEPATVLLEKIREERKKTLGNKYKELTSIDSSDLFELPEGWMWLRLGEISASMKNGIYKPRQFYNDEGIACLRMYNIEKGFIIWKNIKRMKLTSEEFLDYELKPADILVNRVNSRELVGKSAVITSSLEPCIYESKNIRLRLFNNFTESKYVNFWFLIFGQKYFSRNAQQTVGMASINQEQLSSMPIPFSSIREQQKIIEEIERHFSLIDQMQKTINYGIAQSEKLHQSILKRAFEGKLVPQDLSDEPATKLLERIKVENEKLKQTGKKKPKGETKQQRLISYVK